MRMILAALTVAAGAVHTAADAPHPQTLFQAKAGQRISAFAQDGQMLAWFTPSTRVCNAVHLLQLGSVQVTLPSATAQNVTCRWDVVPPVRLALAGGTSAGASALWTLREAAPPAPLPFDYVLGASFQDPTERRFLEIAHASHGAGLWLGGIAGDASTLVYAVATVDYVNEVQCLANPTLPDACDLKISSEGGGIHRIVGRADQLVPQTGAAIEVAVAGPNVAYVPAVTIDKSGQPLPGAQPIEIRAVADGNSVGEVTPEGTPVAIALSSTLLATLEQTTGGLRLAWYRIDTGAAGGSVAVPSGTSPELSSNGKLIVFRVGRSIRSVDVTSRRVVTLAKAAATPIGLSIEGTRVAWAENVAGRGRIRALFVSP
jgi:hypothetical protein